MNDELKLRECPFCGDEPKKSISEDGYYWIICHKCGCYVVTRSPESAEKKWNRRLIEDAQAARIAELESQVDDLQGELAQSSAVSRIVELEADRDRLREALISAKVVMDYFGESMNNMDIVTDQDEAAVNPLFEAVDEALDTIPDYKEKFDNGLQQAYQRAEAQKENYK